jgi:hypothetical protein
MRITRFADDGRDAIVSGDFGEAYAPSCAEDGCSQRSVRSARRAIVYVRPGVVVIDDRVALDDASFGVTWAAHFATAPTVKGASASATAGGSRVDVATLFPADAHAAVVREPTKTGDGPYRANEPWGPMWRLEVASPTGARERRFLHVIVAGAKSGREPFVRFLDGNGLTGALVNDVSDGLDADGVDVLFADNERGGDGLVAPASDRVIVVGLRPDARYHLASECAGPHERVYLTLDEQAEKRANAGGVLSFATPACRR